SSVGGLRKSSLSEVRRARKAAPGYPPAASADRRGPVRPGTAFAARPAACLPNRTAEAAAPPAPIAAAAAPALAALVLAALALAAFARRRSPRAACRARTPGNRARSSPPATRVHRWRSRRCPG